MKKSLVPKALAACCFLIASFSLFVVSCGGGDDGRQSGMLENEEYDEALARLDTIEVRLQANDKMQFDKDQIVVYEGQVVALKLVHTGTMPATSMGHNFVLLSNSISIAAYGKQALREKENDYVLHDPNLTLAHTKMLGGGESDEIIFSAPPKGSYDFICSFPGHYSNMKGKFIVK